MRVSTATILAVALLAAPAAAEPDRIIIPHGLHYENDVACTDCHEGIVESQSALDVFRPGMDVCEACHDVEDDEGCVICHTNPDEAGDYQALVFGSEKFSHAAHDAQDLACASCHGDPAAAQPVLPAKPDCRGCHLTADHYGDCYLCHADGVNLLPDTHGLRWAERHGAQASLDEASCVLCHTQTTCQECHAGDNVRPRSHPLDFAFSHAAAARGQELECAVCHQEPEFCSSCHRAHNVLPRNHSQAGWVTPDGGRHAVDGVFEIEGCIACHDDGPNAQACIECHGGG